MTRGLDKAAIEALLDAAADRLEGDWVLVGGALAAVWVLAGVVARRDRRTSDAQWKKLAAALRALPEDAAGAEALAGIRMARFVPLDAKALAAARAAYAEAGR